jgi:hypothetical protein
MFPASGVTSGNPWECYKDCAAAKEHKRAQRRIQNSKIRNSRFEMQMAGDVTAIAALQFGFVPIFMWIRKNLKRDFCDMVAAVLRQVST